MKKLLLIFLGLLATSCAKPYEQYYTATTKGIDISKFVDVTRTEPKLMIGNDVKSDSIQMAENGYACLGYSSFQGRKINESQAIEQAKKVNASIVLVYSKYLDTLSGYSPLILPDYKTSVTNVTASAYGSSGYATGYGAGTTTTYGTQTTYVPYHIDRFDQGATYWAKKKYPPVLGVRGSEIPPELRQKIGSNKGLLVFVVEKQSPAYRADIVNGDIVKKINNTEIYDESTLESALRLNAEKKVSILLIRDGKEIIKEVVLNPVPPGLQIWE
jgi:membrane-associated protease RseP (regulator of RpoE activity)